MEDARLHDCRHSYASRALALGESLPMIGRLLGHTQFETTARYAHLAKDSVRESAVRISESIAADPCQGLSGRARRRVIGRESPSGGRRGSGSCRARGRRSKKPAASRALGRANGAGERRPGHAGAALPRGSGRSRRRPRTSPVDRASRTWRRSSDLAIAHLAACPRLSIRSRRVRARGCREGFFAEQRSWVRVQSGAPAGGPPGGPGAESPLSARPVDDGPGGFGSRGCQGDCRAA